MGRGLGVPVSARKAYFSALFLDALCSIHGFELIVYTHDYDSVDCSVRSHEGRRPTIDFQLKASSRTDIRRNESIAYPLPRKNYDDLRTPERISPIFLAVLLMRENEADWIVNSPEELLLRGNFYYTSLRSADDKDSHTITVHVPYAQELTSATLRALMERVDLGGTI